MRNVDTNSFSSFDDVEEKDLEHLTLSDELRPNNRIGPHGQQLRAGHETWSCAWAPDCSYFAWSYGGRMVQLVPWDRIQGEVTKSARVFNSVETPDTRQNVYLQDIEQLSRQNSDDALIKPSSNDQSRQPLVLDCGGIVWSVAFGSGSSREDILHMWKRFKFDKELILATGLQNAKIKIWNCHSGTLLIELIDHKDIVKDISFAPNGSLQFVSASRDGTLKLWDLNDDGNMYRTLRGKAGMVYGCKWSPGCKKIAAVGSSKSVVVWDLEDQSIALELRGHCHEVVSCDFSPDGALLATSSYDTKIIIWDVCTGDAILEMGHMYPLPKLIFAGGANDHYVRGVSFRHDGLHVASVCDDGYVRVWDLHDASNPEYIADRPNILCCGFTPDGQTLAVGDQTGCVAFYRSQCEIPRLQHMCRMTICKHIPSSKVDFLHLPLAMKEYLKYHKI